MQLSDMANVQITLQPFEYLKEDNDVMAGGVEVDAVDKVKNTACTGRISSIPIIFYPRIEHTIATTKAKHPNANPRQYKIKF